MISKGKKCRTWTCNPWIWGLRNQFNICA